MTGEGRKLSDYPPDHVLDTLRRFEAGESVGDVNRRPTFSYRGSATLAFLLREEGYVREVKTGEEPVTPYVQQGGFLVTSWPTYRSVLTEKGRSLLDSCEEGIRVVSYPPPLQTMADCIAERKGAVPDFPTARFEERRQVVAIVPWPQRDDPPGRGEVEEREIVIASHVRGLRPDVVETAVLRTARGADSPGGARQ